MLSRNSLLTKYGIKHPPRTIKLKARVFEDTLRPNHMGNVFDVITRGLLRELNKDVIIKRRELYQKHYGHKIEYPIVKEEYTIDFIEKIIRAYFHMRLSYTQAQIYNASFDLMNVIQIIPIKRFIAKIQCGVAIMYSKLGSHKAKDDGEIDLLIDDTIIDVKLYNDLRFSETELIQLLRYYSFLTHKGFNINRIGIYYARHGYFWVIRTDQINYFEQLHSIAVVKNKAGY